MPGSEDYVVNLGVNASQLQQQVGLSIDQIRTLQGAATQSSAALQNSFTQGGQAAQQFDQNIRNTTVLLTQLREQGKTLGTEIAAGLKGTGLTDGMKQKLTELKSQLASFSKDNAKITLNLDGAALQRFETQIGQAKNEFQELGTVVQFARERLNNLAPDSTEFQQLNQQVELASGFLEGLGNAADIVNQRIVPLKTQLRQLREAMAQMEMAGQADTAEFRAMAQQAGALQDQIGDTQSQIRALASDTKNLDAGVAAVQGLAGGFAAAQGAVALFGSENEELNKVLVKVNGAMAVLQGIQALANTLNKDSALMVVLRANAERAATASSTALATSTTAEAAATAEATVATNGLTAALLANPITAVAVAIAAIVAALLIWGGSANETEEDLKSLNDEIERQNYLISLNDDALKRAGDIQTAYAKLAGKSEKEIADIEKETLQGRIDQREAFIKQNQAKLDEMNVTNKKDAEEYAKIQDGITKAESEVLDLRTEIQVKGIDAQTADNKKRKELADKALAEAKKNAEEQKKIADQLLKFTQSAAVSRVAALEDGVAKERRAIILDYQNKIEQVQNEKALSKDAETAQTALVEALTNERNKKLTDLNKKTAADRLQLQFQANQQLADAQKDGAAKDLALLEADYAEKKNAIETTYKDEESLRIQLLTALETKTEAERKKIALKGKQDQIEEAQNKELALIDVASAYSVDNKKAEEKKQIAVLEVKVKYAQKALDALVASGADENSVQVLQAKATVANLQKELKTAVDGQKGQGVTLLDLLGISDNLTDDQISAITKAAGQAVDALKSITASVVDLYDQQIDKQKEKIKATDDEISDLEDQLDEEKDLQEKGYANNVATIEKELAAKQAEKDEQVKQEQDLIKKRNAMKKAQILIDTATQASNLITASTEIFSSLASIPFVGVPLAIATIALMLGAFTAAKVSAFKAVDSSSTDSFGKGGVIDGKSHRDGGVKYKSMDGSGKVVELEGGEFVIRKSSTQKYYNLLDAMNEDKLDSLGLMNLALAELLEGTGVHLSSDSQDRAMGEKLKLEKLQVTVVNQAPDHGEDIRETNRLLRSMIADSRDRPTSWEDDKYTYIKRNNKTTRIPKKQLANDEQ
jgi:hypothetical protein